MRPRRDTWSAVRRLGPLVAILAALVVAAGCGGGPNGALLNDARAAADPVVEAAPTAFDSVIEEGSSGTPKAREQLREQIEEAADALITRASEPFDLARTEARAADSPDDELFEEARGEVEDLIRDAQDEALAEVDALDP